MIKYMAKRQFTAVYQKRGNRYIAWIEEIPGVNTQGRTKAEAKENLREAFSLILDENRRLALKFDRKSVFREPFLMPAS